MKATLKITALYLRQAEKLVRDEERLAMEERIAANPELAPVIRGTGGLRKARWGLPGRGKSGGVRAIYLYLAARRTVYMLALYSKSAKADLTPQDRKALRRIVAAIMEEERME